MAISQRSTKAEFMQPRRGVKKSDTERDIIHLRPNRAVGVLIIIVIRCLTILVSGRRGL